MYFNVLENECRAPFARSNAIPATFIVHLTAPVSPWQRMPPGMWFCTSGAWGVQVEAAPP